MSFVSTPYINTAAIGSRISFAHIRAQLAFALLWETPASGAEIARIVRRWVYLFPYVLPLTVTKLTELIYIFHRLLSSLFLLIIGCTCYLCNFVKSMKEHPRYHKNQIWEEARQSLMTLFWASVLTVPILFAQVRGYAKLYDIGHGTVSSTYEVAQLLYFLVFSETCTYWLHRLFHHPFLFKTMHKKHHR